jgi:hypothetical protein
LCLNSESRTGHYVHMQGLGYSTLHMVSPCHPPFESDTEICYIIHKENVFFVNCSKSSRTLKTSGEIDRLCFPFIDLYAPVFTPRITCSEAALQFAVFTIFVFLCRVDIDIVREQNKMSSRCRGAIIYI